MNIKPKDTRQEFLHMIKAGQVFRIGQHSFYMMIVADPSVFPAIATPPLMTVVDLITGDLCRFHKDKLVDLVDGQFVEGA
jgi:hypothetical protein